MRKNNLRPVIGLEIHIELKTKSKMFCFCSADHFRVKPNSHTCPTCLGLPGALPVPNKKAIEKTIFIGLALNCQILPKTKFDRKNYFYPDLPKGYQISQYMFPLCQKGYLVSGKKRIRINRVHLEEDTGKLLHKKIKGKWATLIDFNRSGVPLAEIVTEPDVSSSQEAKDFLKNLAGIVKFIGVSDCSMEKGTMRLEANISLAQRGEKLPGYKVEIKNLNSFRFVQQAIDYEIKRQTKIINNGELPKQETRGWNSKKKITFSQRTKEASYDYRYFPEPDIPVIEWSQEEINHFKSQLPPIPQVIKAKLISDYNLSTKQADFFIKKKKLIDYFKGCVREAKDSDLSPQEISQVIINKRLDFSVLTPSEFVAQIRKKKRGRIDDIEEIKKIVKKAIRDNQEVVQEYRVGKKQAIEVLIGAAMKISRGRIDPRLIRKVLKELLGD